MKNLKAFTKRQQSPKNNTNNLQPLPSQRSRNNSQKLLHKYKQNLKTDISKQSALPNKYRIVTQPFDDHLLQLSQSYAKLTRPSKKEGKFQSKHNSIKSKQKTVSNQKYQPKSQQSCLSCQNYQKQLGIMLQNIKKLISLKQQWKNGGIIISDFQKQTSIRRQTNIQKQNISVVEEIHFHFLDLMRDIEVLTQIDYPKLLSLSIINNQQITCSAEEEEIKILFNQLREQVEGKTIFWDMDQYSANQSVRTVMRNLKVNFMHCLRQNMELRIRAQISRRDEHVSDEDIRRAVEVVLAGARQ